VNDCRERPQLERFKPQPAGAVVRDNGPPLVDCGLDVNWLPGLLLERAAAKGRTALGFPQCHEERRINVQPRAQAVQAAHLVFRQGRFVPGEGA